MGDYIDREALKEKFWNACKNCLSEDDIADLIDDIPAADVAPVVHGEWVRNNNEEICLTVKCSVCGMAQPLWAKRDYKFCHDCGAKMDKEDSNQ